MPPFCKFAILYYHNRLHITTNGLLPSQALPCRILRVSMGREMKPLVNQQERELQEAHHHLLVQERKNKVVPVMRVDGKDQRVPSHRTIIPQRKDLRQNQEVLQKGLKQHMKLSKERYPSFKDDYEWQERYLQAPIHHLTIKEYWVKWQQKWLWLMWSLAHVMHDFQSTLIAHSSGLDCLEPTCNNSTCCIVSLENLFGAVSKLTPELPSMFILYRLFQMHFMSGTFFQMQWIQGLGTSHANNSVRSQCVSMWHKAMTRDLRDQTFLCHQSSHTHSNDDSISELILSIEGSRCCASEARNDVGHKSSGSFHQTCRGSYIQWTHYSQTRRIQMAETVGRHARKGSLNQSHHSMLLSSLGLSILSFIGRPADRMSTSFSKETVQMMIQRSDTTTP